METTSLVVPGIVCEGCANAIKKAVGKVEGVSEVEVNVATKTVTVTHDAKTPRQTIASALDRAGFPVAS